MPPFVPTALLSLYPPGVTSVLCHLDKVLLPACVGETLRTGKRWDSICMCSSFPQHPSGTLDPAFLTFSSVLPSPHTWTICSLSAATEGLKSVRLCEPVVQIPLMASDLGYNKIQVLGACWPLQEVQSSLLSVSTPRHCFASVPLSSLSHFSSDSQTRPRLLPG